MKVLLRKNVSKLGIIGDVVDVKPGYARNYLIPCRLGVMPTKGNIKTIEAEKEAYLQQVAKEQSELQAKAKLIDGKEVTIASRANEEGHLYGSVGPAQIAAALAADNVFVDVENIVLDEPIRQLDKYDVLISFGENAKATIAVWIVPNRESDVAEDSPEQAGDQATGAEQAPNQDE